MPLAMIRANLGKWGRNTQTFYEHGVSVHSFRTLFNVPSQRIVAGLAKECGMDQYLLDLYNNLVFLESLYHDYDKLFIPEDMLRDTERMRSFPDHGDIRAERNREALKELISSLERGDEERYLPTGTINFLRKVDMEVLEEILRAANASHEGMRLPEKVEMVAEALDSFFKQVGCQLSDPLKLSLARTHLMSLRVADSIASAYEGKPSFKSDVTEVVDVLIAELIRSFQQLIPRPGIHVASFSLNPALLEARSPSVVTSFLSFYDELRKIVDYGMIRKGMGDLYILRGSVIEDNSSIIVAMWVGDRDEAPDLSGLGEISGEVLQDLVTIRHWSIDLVERKGDFDLELRRTLMDAIHSGFKPVAETDGLPCYSCGRPMARVVTTEDLEDQGLDPKKFGEEMLTFERSMQLGYLRAISSPIYGVNSSMNHNDRPLCPTCLWLFSRSTPHKGIPVTFILYGAERIAEISSPPCSEDSDPLVVETYSYYLRNVLLSKLMDSLTFRDLRAYGLGVMSSFMTSKGEELLGDLRTLLHDVGEKLKVWSEELPCGVVRYEFKWGLRVGNGPVSEGKIWDHTLLKGVWSPEEYEKLLGVVEEAIRKIRSLRLRPDEIAHKLGGGDAHMSAVLLKEMGERIPKELTLTKFMEIVRYLRETDELGALRIIREVMREE